MILFQVQHNSPESLNKEDNWCWEKSNIDIAVGADDVQGIEFVQKGYLVNFVSTHDVDAFMTQPDGSPKYWTIKVCLSSFNSFDKIHKFQHVNSFPYLYEMQKGSQHICVEYPGEHELHIVSSCINFGSSSIKIDTSNSSVYCLFRTFILFCFLCGLGLALT